VPAAVVLTTTGRTAALRTDRVSRGRKKVRQVIPILFVVECADLRLVAEAQPDDEGLDDEGPDDEGPDDDGHNPM